MCEYCEESYEIPLLMAEEYLAELEVSYERQCLLRKDAPPESRTVLKISDYRNEAYFKVNFCLMCGRDLRGE